MWFVTFLVSYRIQLKLTSLCASEMWMSTSIILKLQRHLSELTKCCFGSYRHFAQVVANFHLKECQTTKHALAIVFNSKVNLFLNTLEKVVLFTQLLFSKKYNYCTMTLTFSLGI